MEAKVIQEIVDQFEDSLADGNLSRLEKRELKAQLRRHNFEKRSLDLIRHNIFELARINKDGHPPTFIIDWLETANKLLLSSSDLAFNEDVYFSPGDGCLEAIINAIRKAINSISICVFTITDNRITKVIIDAHYRGVKVRIITDDDKSFDLGSDTYELNAAGIPVKIDNSPQHMHHKFAVIDQSVVLTGSYNWTRGAADLNHENLLVSESQGLIHSYLKEFDKLWNTMEYLN